MSDSLINKIIDQVNIVDVVGEYVDLQKKGRNFWAICPFHQDSNPSMSVSQEKHIYKCFVCGAGGNVINFVSDFEKISYGKALTKLAERIGLEVENTFEPKPTYSEKQLELISVLKDANNFFQYSLTTSEGKIALDYAEKRGLDAKTRETFKIGYAPENGLIEFLRKKGHQDSAIINASLMNQIGNSFYKNRLMYGITNSFGDIIAFSGRLLEGEGPKYINSSESLVFDKSSTLYNLYEAKDVIEKDKEVFINEGFMDVIAMVKAGFRNSVAVMGTALTEKHLRLLKDAKVTLMLDSDQAGINATMKSTQLLISNKVPTYIVYNKGGKDPDEIFNNFGKEKLVELANSKVPSLQFVYAVLKKQFKLESPDDIQNLIKEFGKYLANSSDLEKDFYANKISQEFNLGVETVLNLIPGKKLQRTFYQQPERTASTNETTQEIKTREVKNNHYLLIRSMIKKPMFIDLIIKNPVNFGNDLMLLGISKYLIDLRDNKKVVIDQKYKTKVKEILDESNEVIETNEEFIDLIKVVNKKSKDVLFNSVNVKLNNAQSSEEKIRILEQMRKIKKRG